MQFAVQFYRQYAAELKETLDHIPWLAVNEVVDHVFTAWVEQRQVFIMGNGGSASTATHMACDLSKNTAVPGHPRLRALALNDNMALFSALANDCGYENVFRDQLLTYLNPKDVVIGISASGNSPNVLNGMVAARERGATTVGLSGYHGGKLATMVDVAVVVPNHCIEQIEDLHLMLEHIITSAVRQAIHQAVKKAA
ncbi:MAG: SIS domain-containing protein [Caldilineaceae bacterium]|nr:SIS domain-containing protein [Caldilineaceae bacterium]